MDSANQVLMGIYQGYFTSLNSRTFSFDLEHAQNVIANITPILINEPTILDLDSSKDHDFIVVGDIHGNLDSLLKIFTFYGHPPKAKYIFLGDYVDRGSNSSEVMMVLLSFKLLCPNSIYLLRGNHEFRSMSDHYGFKKECKDKESTSKLQFYQSVTSIFKYLSLGAILDNKTFFVHGGITALVSNREELMELPKVGDEFTETDGAMAELLWNDPAEDETIQYYTESPRKIGCIFGQQALLEFLTKMNFELVVRAHQTVEKGYLWNFEENRYILTLFSSLDYCGLENDCGVLRYSIQNGDLALSIETFSQVTTSHKLTIQLPEECFKNQVALKPPLSEIRQPKLPRMYTLQGILV